MYKIKKNSKRSGLVTYTIITSCFFAFFSQYKLTSFRYSPTLYLIAISVVPLLKMLASSRLRITLSFRSLLMFLFIVSLIVGTFGSAEFSDSLLIAICKMLVFVIFVYLLKQREWGCLFKKSLSLITLIFIVSAYIELISPNTISNINRMIMTPESYMTVSTLQSQGYRLGICNQASYFAFDIAALIAFVFAYLLITPKKKVLRIILLVACIGALMLSGKRAELFAVVLAFGASVIFLLFSRNTSTSKKAKYIIIMGICVAVTYYFLFESSFGLLLFEKGLSFGYDTTRTMLFQRAIALWKSNPIIGVGTNYFSQGFAYSAHNSYLQLLCENGLIGLSIYILFILHNLTVTIKAMKANILENENRVYLYASFIFQVFFIASSYFESMYANNVMWIIYLIFVAMVSSVNVDQKRNNASVEIVGGI